jgi:hypothetical protein
MSFYNSFFFRKNNHPIFIFVYLLLLANPLFAQVKVTMPVERSVFQRVNSVASIQIGGNILVDNAILEARMLPIQGGQVVDWQSINANISKGTFVGELANVFAGWYKLEVRAVVNGIQLGNVSSVAKVGVGEVFIIAGQSNAQGGRPPEGGFVDFTTFGASDDRVNCINLYDNNTQSLLPFPQISQLKADSYLAPVGKASWCWGLLGDRLARELNCPILFFNGAIGATRAEQWAQAARGENAYDYYALRQAPKGWPYAFLQKSINYYASLFGMRAVLWHQGEEDSVIGTNPKAYFSNIETVIDKSRENAGKNISWIIAKVTRSKLGISNEIKAAQQLLADSKDNVFAGPDTDGIQPASNFRDEGVHFHGSGFIDLANAWAESILTENFFNKSKPFLANKLVKSTIEACRVNYEIGASLPSNYTNPIWIWNGGNSRQEAYNKTIIAYDENYALLKDNLGNILISPPFSFTPTNDIEIKLNQSPKICAGQSLSISASSSSNNFLWSTGQTTKEISINNAGNYSLSVSSPDVYGCIAKAEANIKLEVISLPPAPVIEPLSATTFCEGGFVEIKDKSTDNYFKSWNTNETTKSINVVKGGNYFLQNTDENGCKSPFSNTITVAINPLPQKPLITTTAKAHFCVGDSIKLMATAANNFIWTVGNKEIKTNQAELFVKASGDYKLVTTNQFGCLSPISEPFTVVELQLPEAPVLEYVGKPIFCAGGSVELFTKYSAKAYNWFSTGGNVEASVNQRLKIASNKNQPNSSKSYFLKVADENNCVSKESNLINVTIKANPTSPIIDQVGLFRLKAANISSNLDYKWLFEGKLIDLQAAEIKALKSGKYNVLAEQQYSLNNETLICSSDLSLDFILNLDGFDLVMYPNPVVDGSFYIETLSDDKKMSLRIVSVLGQEVLFIQNIDTSKRKQISVNNLSGMFFVEVISKGKMYRKQIMIN